MVKIVFVSAEGEERAVEAEEGRTVMEAAVANNIEGIVAECGGACSCATCHAFIDEAWFEKVGAPGDDEKDMLDFAPEVRPTSRLTCQITLSSELDGLRVSLPSEQG